MSNLLKNVVKVIIWPIIFLVGQFLIVFIISLPFRIKSSSLVNFNELLNNYIADKTLLISVITFLVFLPIFVNKYKKYKSDCSSKLKLRNIAFYILLGGAINLIFNIIIFNFNQIFSFTNNYNNFNNSVFISLILTGILGPILEEYLFRGICFNKLKKAFNLNISLILSCFIFSLFHNNVLNMIYAFIVGIVLVMYYEKNKNIFVPICIHIGSNFFSILLYNTIISDNVIINSLILLVSLVILVFSFIKNK